MGAPNTVALVDSGPEFRRIRLALGIKQSEVVQALGIHAGNLSRFEKGEKTLAAGRVVELYRSLGCDVLLVQNLEYTSPEPITKDEMAAMERYAKRTRGAGDIQARIAKIEIRK